MKKMFFLIVLSAITFSGGELAHVVVMQHVTRNKIDSFIQDLLRSKR
jgi:hypothetical protein